MSKCPKCDTEYLEVEVDFEYGDIILRNAKALKCPRCKEELFTPEQYSAIRNRIHSVVQPLRLKRKISTAGKKPIVYLPEDVVKAINAKIGDEVDVYVEGKKIIIEKT
ncbi:MAG TPA: AbrB/MazE/SpoVT family DNA-binding domain-containing protein [Candidatus Bathyarchaeia archaeon]|jgi:YgiT-type zinc finger domain-containing protein